MVRCLLGGPGGAAWSLATNWRLPLAEPPSANFIPLSFASATKPFGLEPAGFLIPPRKMNVTVARITRMAAAPSVQPTSSGVLPRVCAGAAPPRRGGELAHRENSRRPSPAQD